MNLERLKQAEADFLVRYPGGFDNPEMQSVRKKHPVDRVAETARELLHKNRFGQQAQVMDSIIKLTSRSSMISMFEKPKFRDYVNGLSRDDREHLTAAFKKLLHGNQRKGFEDVIEMLSEAKLAKWSLISIHLFNLRPEQEVFVKPTTTKKIIQHLELEDLVYKPRPSYDFYATYRDAINHMKAQVDPSLGPNNAAFTGFLMMSVG